MKPYDVEPTAQVILDAAETLERSARNLRYRANKMLEEKDPTHAAEAVNTLVNIWSAVRLDLLVSRPLRATMHD